MKMQLYGIYKLMKNMWVDTDSLAFSPRKKDMGYYFDFLMCKLTCYHPHGKVKVSHKEFVEKPDNLPERPERIEHHDRPDRSFKGPRKFKK